MSGLARWQRDFGRALEGESDAPLAAHGGGWDDARAARLAIYRGNLRAARRRALASTYPVVRRLVGEGFFGELALRYAERWPSRSGDLGLYGAELPGFIREDSGARGLPCLADVARLEWAMHESLAAADAALLDASALARVPESRQPRLLLRLHPAVRLVESPHPILAILEANGEGRDGTPERIEGPDRVVVWRPGPGVRARRLLFGEWALLAALDRGAELGDALDAMDPHDREGFGAALARFGVDGLLAGFTLPPDAA